MGRDLRYFNMNYLHSKKRKGVDCRPFPGITNEDPEMDMILNNVNIEMPEAVDNDTLDLTSGNNETNYEVAEDGNLIPIANFEASFLTKEE
ncbi:hypothetical protein C0J52_06342 [Blattella germanica]|nr:hypothetical protein C0J52_06342 [Blattella germanica]